MQQYQKWTQRVLLELLGDSNNACSVLKQLQSSWPQFCCNKSCSAQHLEFMRGGEKATLVRSLTVSGVAWLPPLLVALLYSDLPCPRHIQGPWKTMLDRVTTSTLCRESQYHH